MKKLSQATITKILLLSFFFFSTSLSLLKAQEWIYHINEDMKTNLGVSWMGKDGLTYHNVIKYERNITKHASGNVSAKDKDKEVFVIALNAEGKIEKALKNINNPKHNMFRPYKDNRMLLINIKNDDSYLSLIDYEGNIVRQGIVPHRIFYSRAERQKIDDGHAFMNYFKFSSPIKLISTRVSKDLKLVDKQIYTFGDELKKNGLRYFFLDGLLFDSKKDTWLFKLKFTKDAFRVPGDEIVRMDKGKIIWKKDFGSQEWKIKHFFQDSGNIYVLLYKGYEGGRCYVNKTQYTLKKIDKDGQLLSEFEFELQNQRNSVFDIQVYNNLFYIFEDPGVKRQITGSFGIQVYTMEGRLVKDRIIKTKDNQYLKSVIINNENIVTISGSDKDNPKAKGIGFVMSIDLDNETSTFPLVPTTLDPIVADVTDEPKVYLAPKQQKKEKKESIIELSEPDKVAPVVKNVSVFPNPANDIINFKFETEKAINTDFVILLFDVNCRLMEQKIFKGMEHQINIERYPSGTYFYVIKNTQIKGETISGKFVKISDK